MLSSAPTGLLGRVSVPAIIIGTSKRGDVNVSFFQARIPGPEQAIEDAVLREARTLFGAHSQSWATLASVRIGAGIPDLTFCAFRSVLRDYPLEITKGAAILGYLRGVVQARPDTIARRLAAPVDETEETLKQLREKRIARSRGGVYWLDERWKHVLSQVITVEAKVTDWRGAVDQAIRNLLFSTRSYIALPATAAARASAYDAVRQFGIGVLAVDENGEVSIERRGRSQAPRLWAYYYQVAQTLAHVQSVKGTNALSSIRRRRPGPLP